MKNYLNNKDIMEAVKESKTAGRMSDRLATMLKLLVGRYAKSSRFIGYTFNDDMQGYALLMLVRTWDRFDEQKYSNAFAYYTQCTHNSFLQFLKKEKKQRDVRDELLLKGGLNCSWTYTEDNKENDDG